MKTMSERIEAACIEAWEARRDIHGRYPDEGPWEVQPPQMQEWVRHEYERSLRAAFPEMFTEPATAWLAPWEFSGVIDHQSIYYGSVELWRMFRNAHLSPPPTLTERKTE